MSKALVMTKTNIAVWKRCPECRTMFKDEASLLSHRQTRHGFKAFTEEPATNTESEAIRRASILKKRKERRKKRAQQKSASASAKLKRGKALGFNKRGIRIYETFKCAQCSIKAESGWRYKVDVSQHVKICNRCKARRKPKTEPSSFAKSRMFVQGGAIETNRRKY